MTQIGTLNEGPLHASIKKWYKKAGDKQEVEVDGYIIDLVRGDQLIEIQTANFSQISRKIVRLTNLHPLKLVYPVAQTKWLCKNASRRKSPKRGRWLQLFDELVSIPQVLASDNFSIEIIDLQTVSPIDFETIKNSLIKTKKLLVCQEAPPNSSVGTTVISKVVESDLFNILEVAPKLISGLHSPMPSAKHLESTVIPQKEDILNAIQDML